MTYMLLLISRLLFFSICNKAIDFGVSSQYNIILLIGNSIGCSITEKFNKLVAILIRTQKIIHSRKTSTVHVLIVISLAFSLWLLIRHTLNNSFTFKVFLDNFKLVKAALMGFLSHNKVILRSN